MGVENKTELDAYIKTLTILKQYQYDQGLEDDPPKESIVINLAAENPGRPPGAKIPLYPDDEIGSDEIKKGKLLFNLKALINFTPPVK
jgi:hypothetical protein